MTSTLELLKRCSRFYHSGELTADCLNNPRPCVRVPRECITHNAVYTILHYLTDHDFMSPRNVSAHQAPQFFCLSWRACLKQDLVNFDMLDTFLFGVSSDLSQQKSPKAEIIGIFSRNGCSEKIYA